MITLSIVLQYLPTRLVIIVGYIVGIAFMNWLIHGEEDPDSKKCSPNHPEFSVQIEYPEFLPDGGVREDSSGELYPRGAWWQRNEEIWGCPCNLGKPCLRKCCPLGEEWKMVSIENDQFVFYCRQKITNGNITDSLDVYERKYTPPGYEWTNVSPDHFLFYHKECQGYLDHNEQMSNRVVLLDDGTLLHIHTYFIVDQSHFCVDNVDGVKTLFKYCDSLTEKLINQVDNYYISKVLIIITSMIIIMFTLSVYALVPRLRRGFGTPIMCYLATELVNKLFKWMRMNGECEFIDYRTYYTWMSVEAWAIAVSYHMWSLAGPVKARPRLLLHCGLAWGVPLAITVAIFVVDVVPGVPEILKTRKEGSKCPFESNNFFVKWLYFLIPLLVMKFVNPLLCGATLVRLAAGKRNSNALQGPDSSRHNANEVKWASLYVKVFLILGTNYFIYTFLLALVDSILMLHPGVTATLSEIILLRGVEVFIISVCQKKMLSAFSQRLAFWRK